MKKIKRFLKLSNSLSKGKFSARSAVFLAVFAASAVLAAVGLVLSAQTDRVLAGNVCVLFALFGVLCAYRQFSGEMLPTVRCVNSARKLDGAKALESVLSQEPERELAPGIYSCGGYVIDFGTGVCVKSEQVVFLHYEQIRYFPLISGKGKSCVKAYNSDRTVTYLGGRLASANCDESCESIVQDILQENPDVLIGMTGDNFSEYRRRTKRRIFKHKDD